MRRLSAYCSRAAWAAEVEALIRLDRGEGPTIPPAEDWIRD
jgi:hypothetical protein